MYKKSTYDFKNLYFRTFYLVNIAFVMYRHTYMVNMHNAVKHTYIVCRRENTIKIELKKALFFREQREKFFYIRSCKAKIHYVHFYGIQT